MRVFCSFACISSSFTFIASSVLLHSQIMVAAASAEDTALVAAHIVVLAGKDTDSVVHLPDIFPAVVRVVYSLPDRIDRVVEAVDKMAVQVGNTVGVVEALQRKPSIPAALSLVVPMDPG